VVYEESDLFLLKYSFYTISFNYFQEELRNVIEVHINIHFCPSLVIPRCRYELIESKKIRFFTHLRKK